MRKRLTGVVLALATLLTPALAAGPDLKTPAKQLFGKVKLPSEQKSTPVGSYAKGCLAGAVALPVDGPDWQVMRLSRNRNWGMPQLVNYIEKFSAAASRDGWPGLLVGDMSQPRGGPMITGHASHQIGLDVDIWFVPMPNHTLTRDEREKTSAISMLMKGALRIDPGKWSRRHRDLLKRAASYPEVARIFVSAAIKQNLCDTAGSDRTWLRKIRPWWGHNDHFHVRLVCPPGMAGCSDQTPPPEGDGCGDELAEWFKPPPPPPPKPKTPKKPILPPPPLTLAGLPKACIDVFYAKDAEPD